MSIFIVGCFFVLGFILVDKGFLEIIENGKFRDCFNSGYSMNRKFNLYKIV